MLVLMCIEFKDFDIFLVLPIGIGSAFCGRFVTPCQQWQAIDVCLRSMFTWDHEPLPFAWNPTNEFSVVAPSAALFKLPLFLSSKFVMPGLKPVDCHFLDISLEAEICKTGFWLWNSSNRLRICHNIKGSIPILMPFGWFDTEYSPLFPSKVRENNQLMTAKVLWWQGCSQTF